MQNNSTNQKSPAKSKGCLSNSSKYDKLSTSAHYEESYVDTLDGKIKIGRTPHEVSVLQKSDSYSHEYNNQPHGKGKSGLRDGYDNGAATFTASKRSQNNSDYYRNEASAEVKSDPPVTSTRRSIKRNNVKKNQPYFQSNNPKDVPSNKANQAEEIIDTGVIAGMSTGARLSQPYNFSYGDQDQDEPETRSNSNIDTGFIAGMSTGARLSQPYNFSYGDHDQDEPETRRSNNNIDTGFIAGMSTGARLSQPYNFSYGDHDQDPPITHFKAKKYDMYCFASYYTASFFITSPFITSLHLSSNNILSHHMTSRFI